MKINNKQTFLKNSALKLLNNVWNVITNKINTFVYNVKKVTFFLIINVRRKILSKNNIVFILVLLVKTRYVLGVKKIIFYKMIFVRVIMWIV